MFMADEHGCGCSEDGECMENQYIREYWLGLEPAMNRVENFCVERQGRVNV